MDEENKSIKFEIKFDKEVVQVICAFSYIIFSYIYGFFLTRYTYSHASELERPMWFFFLLMFIGSPFVVPIRLVYLLLFGLFSLLTWGI